jgi:hypothetical protein
LQLDRGFLKKLQLNVDEEIHERKMHLKKKNAPKIQYDEKSRTT